MDEHEKQAVEFLLFGIPPGGGRAVRVTRPTGVTLQPASLDRISREEQEVAETMEQLGYRAAYQVGQKRAPAEWFGYYGDRAMQIGDLRAERIEKKVDGSDEDARDYTVIVKVTASDAREVFLRATGTTDSYGDNETFGTFQIVTPKTVTTTVYE